MNIYIRSVSDDNFNRSSDYNDRKLIATCSYITVATQYSDTMDNVLWSNILEHVVCIVIHITMCSVLSVTIKR